MDKITLTLPPEISGRLDKALAVAAPDDSGLSRSGLMRLMAAGAVIGPDGPVRDGKAKARPGNYEITPPEIVSIIAQPQDIPLQVIYEDAELIVVDKPAGMVVHPAPGTPDGTLVNALLAHCGDSLSGIGGAKRPGIVHRIDKDTSGLLVVAKTDLAHQVLSQQFKDKTARRRYLALTHGVLDPADARLRSVAGASFGPDGTLRLQTMLDRHPHDRQRQAVHVDRGRNAVTHVRMLEKFGTPASAMLAECRLETGRTHQIRVHMAYAGLGLIGDRVYGGARRASTRALGANAEAVAAFGRQALHAANLGFKHPSTGEEMDFETPLPDDMQILLDQLRGTATTKTRCSE